MRFKHVRIPLLMIAFMITANLNCSETNAATTIFQDDFESTTLDIWNSTSDPAWTNSVSNAHSGTRKARIAGNVENANLIKSISTQGVSGLVLSFWYDTSTGWDSADGMVVEWSNDGLNWQQLGEVSGDDKTPLVEGGEEWVEKSYVLPAAADNSGGFVFRFRATISGQTDILFIDDVALTAGSGGSPTLAPTTVPTQAPTPIPTVQPTVVPTAVPTVVPTQMPTIFPTAVPTSVPTSMPTQTPDPTEIPEKETMIDTLLILLRQRIEVLFRLLKLLFQFIW